MESKSRKSIVKMDPDCAICHAPATVQCDCEAKGLEVAVRQAEQKMMTSMFNDIRSWVRAHAQDYILEYFRLLTERRKEQHSNHLERMTQHAYHYYHAPPHPNEIQAAQAALKRGIDEDWQASVQRYPEVLEYFYSLVELTLPGDDDSVVKDPPLSALNGSRSKPSRRSVTGPLATDPFHERPSRTRTPPAIERRGGRTTAPPMSLGLGMPPPPRRSGGAPRWGHPPPPPSFYGGGPPGY